MVFLCSGTYHISKTVTNYFDLFNNVSSWNFQHNFYLLSSLWINCTASSDSARPSTKRSPLNWFFAYIIPIRHINNFSRLNYIYAKSFLFSNVRKKLKSLNLEVTIGGIPKNCIPKKQITNLSKKQASSDKKSKGGSSQILWWSRH